MLNLKCLCLLIRSKSKKSFPLNNSLTIIFNTKALNKQGKLTIEN